MRNEEYITHTEEYRGYNIEIVADNDAQNPRTEDDNACTMVCWHSRYTLGDTDTIAKREKPVSAYYSEPIALLYELAGLDIDNYRDEHEYNEMPKEELYRLIEEKGTLISPLYLYDHSGITISMGGFSCPWDSGQVGWIYVTKETIENEWGNGPDAYHKAMNCMKSEVETYDDYLTGNVWGWRIGSENDDNIESCWGYYGSEGIKEAIAEAKSSIDGLCKRAQGKYEKEPKKKSAEMYMV